MKKHLVLILQTLVSLGLLAWIFGNPEFRGQAGRVLRAADPWWLAGGFFMAGAGCLLGVVRWNVFLGVLGIRIPAWDVVRMSFVGLFFNNFMLGAVGGDVVKVVWLAARGHSRTAALLSVLMDRMSGLGALVIASLVFMLARWDWLMRSAITAAR